MEDVIRRFVRHAYWFPGTIRIFLEEAANDQFEPSRQRDAERNGEYSWRVHSASLLDVIWDDDFHAYYQETDALITDAISTVARPTAVGFLKNKCWDFEQETRIRADLAINDSKGTKLDRRSCELIDASPPDRHTFCSIPDHVLRALKIMISPNSSDALVTMMKNEIH